MISEETREKMRVARLGKRHSPETREKLRLSHLGKTLSVESRLKLSRSLMGHPVSDTVRVKSSETMRHNNPVRFRHYHPLSDETKMKMSQAKKGKPGHLLSLEHREKLRQANLGNKHCLGRKLSDETKKKIGLANSIRPRTEAEKEFLRHLNTNPIFTTETRCKISETSKGRVKSSEARAKLSQSLTGKTHAPETKAKIGRIKKKAWQDPEWRDKVVLSQIVGRKEVMKRDPTWRARQIEAQRKGYSLFPNKAETALLNLLEQDYPNEWAYVGNGSLIIGNWNPDFANVNGHKELIEVFGDHWHRGQNPQDRIDLFKRFGFRTLVIWECELKQLDGVREQVACFVRDRATGVKVGD